MTTREETWDWVLRAMLTRIKGPVNRWKLSNNRYCVSTEKAFRSEVLLGDDVMPTAKFIAKGAIGSLGIDIGRLKPFVVEVTSPTGREDSNAYLSEPLSGVNCFDLLVKHSSCRPALPRSCPRLFYGGFAPCARS